MDWIVLWAFLNIGMNDAVIADNGYGIFQTPSPGYFVEYGVVAEVSRFTFSAGMENMFFKDPTSRIIGGFMPYHDTYWLETEFRFTDWLSIVANHRCEHSVDVQDRSPELLKYDEAETRLYLSTRIGK